MDDADTKRIAVAADRLNREAQDVLVFQAAFNDLVDADCTLLRITAASHAADGVGATDWVDELARWRQAIKDADPRNVAQVLPGAMALVRQVERQSANASRRSMPEMRVVGAG